MKPLVEQVILITGATDGLGKAVAMLLAHAESQAYDRQARSQLRKLSEQLTGLTDP